MNSGLNRGFSKMTRKALLVATSVSALVIASSAAQAGSFSLREQDTVANGSAFAGTAAGAGGISSMYWNPAIMTQWSGLNTQQNFSIIAPQGKITATSATAGPNNLLAAPFNLRSPGDVSQTALLPSGAVSYQLTDKIFIGLTMNTPFGLVTKTPFGSASQTYGTTSKAFSLNVTPTIAYRFNDFISVGAGLQVQYFRIQLKTASGLGFPAPAANFNLKGDDTTIGYTLGVTLTPFKGTNIGIGYRSGHDNKLDGTFATPFSVTRISAPSNLPGILTVGLTQDINAQWQVMAGFEWTNWSQFSRFPVTRTDGPGAGTTLTTLGFDYKDGYYFSLGTAYKYNPSWTFRGGLGYEVSPITDTTRGTRLPDTDRFWATLGASYQLNDKLTLDVSYAHAFLVGGKKIAIVPGNPAYAPPVNFLGKVSGGVDIFNVGFRYHFGETAKKELPVVRKG